MATTRTVHEWFMESVREHPGLPALRIDDADFTYQQLHVASARVAELILAVHGGRPARVGVLASRTLGTYVGYLAGLFLGAAVVPINGEFPVSRNAVVVGAAGLDVLVSPAQTAAHASALGAATAVAPLVLPGDDELLTGGSVLLEPYRAGVDDLAYILFTSGSTGAPKGVPIRHSCVSTYLSHNIPHFAAGPGCRISQTSELTFDLSGFALFVAWGSAATVVVASKLDLLEPARHVVRDRITHWLSVPSVISLARQLQNLPPGGMPDLRWSLFVGEQLTAEQARAWFECAPHSTVENLYGPTEVTISCTSYRLPPEPADWPTVNGTVPIGGPYPLVECLVVDDNGARSDQGELLLRGAQRFDGYLDPALNRGRFAWWDGQHAHVYDGTAELTAEHWYRTGDRVQVHRGELFHLGRLDDQLKIRGYRIEPGDIEAVLRAHPAVDDVVVVARADDEGAAELAAAYIGRPAGAEDLTAFLRGRLPAHMVPDSIVRLDAFPLNVNGKVDRKQLSAQAPAWPI